MENNIIKLKRVVIKEELFSITNDTFEAIILGQMIYWQERVNDFDKFIKEEKERSKKNDVDININDFNGWIYKKANELSNECMLNLSDVSIRRYINKLIDKKFIFCRTNPLYKWDKTLQYRINFNLINKTIIEHGYNGLALFDGRRKSVKSAFSFKDGKIFHKKKLISYNDQLKDKRWKKLANKIRKRDKYTCQLCGSHEHLQVHHKKYIKGRLAWEYDESNLVTLCSECHKKIHHIN